MSGFHFIAYYVLIFKKVMKIPFIPILLHGFQISVPNTLDVIAEVWGNDSFF